MKIILFSLLTFFFPPHAIYISVLEIDHASDSQEVEVRVKIFSDDLADALRDNYQIVGNYYQDDFFDSQKANLQNYFSKHLELDINQSNIDLSLDRIEKENDTHWLYFHADCPGEWERYTIKADFLMEIFPTQSNMVRVMDGEKKQFFRLTKTNSFIQIP